MNSTKSDLNQNMVRAEQSDSKSLVGWEKIIYNKEVPELVDEYTEPTTTLSLYTVSSSGDFRT